MTLRRQLSTLGKAIGREGRWKLLLLALATLAAGAAEFVSLVALLRLLQGWLNPAGMLGLERALLFGAAVAAAGVLRILLLVLTQSLAFGTAHRLLVAVQRRVLARDWVSHAAGRSAGPLAAAEQVEQVTFGLLLPMLQGTTAMVLALAIIVALLRIDAGIALLAVGLLVLLYLLLAAAFRPMLNRASQDIAGGYEERIAAIQDHLGALRELILADALPQAAERFRLVDWRLAGARARVTVAAGLPRILVESLGLLVLTAIGWWVASSPGGLGGAIPVLAALALGAQRLLPLVQTLYQALAGVFSSRSALDRLTELLAGPELIDLPAPSALPFRREIRLEQVAFHYPDRSEAALERIDLVISRGERILLAGPSGSGKSTLADLLMGLLRPSTGAILVDGAALSDQQIRAWQRNIAHVPQAPFLLDDSIAANVSFPQPLRDADPVRIAAALHDAGLSELIASLADRERTRVGERGQLLSGGQRQRLALARALYREAPLLVLDEATSALDPETESAIIATLDRMRQQGVTVVVIAHRASMLAGADRRITLSHGKIVEAV